MKKCIYLCLVLVLAACAPIENSTPIPLEVPLEVVEEEASSLPVPSLASSANPLSQGPLGIVALGDSLTQGDGDDSGLGYPGRLLERINQIRPGSILVNLGQSGWSSDALINGDQGLTGQLPRAADELARLKADGFQTIALVWIGSNDLWYLYEYGGEVTDEGDLQDADRFKVNMQLVVGQLTAEGATVVLALLDDQSKRPVALRGEAFVSITADELSRMSAQVTRYNQILTEIALANRALTVDFTSTDIFTNSTTLADDGNHPNSSGYDTIAEKWYEALLPIIQ